MKAKSSLRTVEKPLKSNLESWLNVIGAGDIVAATTPTADMADMADMAGMAGMGVMVDMEAEDTTTRKLFNFLIEI